MSIVKYSDFGSLLSPFAEDVFGIFPSRKGRSHIGTTGSISVNVSEDTKVYHVQAEIPGVKKDDVEIEFKGSNLILRVQKKDEFKEKTKTTSIQEMSYGFFERSLPFYNIKEDEISAKLENGILYIEIPKNSQSKGHKKKIVIK